MIVRFLTLALAGATLFLGYSPAQSRVILDDGEIFFGFEGFGAMPQATPAAGGAATPAGPPSARLEKLKALEYDRRPSTILKVWSTPPPPPEEAESQEAEAPAETEEEALTAEGGEEAGAEAASEGEAETGAEEAGAEETGAEGETEAGETEGETAEAAPELTPEEAEAAAKAAQEAAQAAQAAAKAAAEAEAEAKRKAEEAKRIEEEMKALQRNVTLGNWGEVKQYFATLTEEEVRGGYEKLLQSLNQGVQQRPNVPPQGQQYIEKNRFSPTDVLGLADAIAYEPTPENIELLGKILRQALDAGHQPEAFLDELRPHLDEEGFALGKRRLALVLVAANEPAYLEGLLPTVAEAEADDDREGLNLISRYCLAMHAKDQKIAWLEEAWLATMAVLAVGEVDEKAKSEALQRAVDIAPKIRTELGQSWLDESFTDRPERGKEILAAIGSIVSTKLAAAPTDAVERLKQIQLQTTATRALLAAAPERASEWSAELDLLAHNWLREALVSYQYDESTSRGPRMERDPFGNFFYWNPGQGRFGNVPTAIRTTDILETRPGDDWLAQVEETLRPRFQMLYAQLLLKLSEEAEAFPYIEEVAARYPRQAKELVDEFLRVWARNHDPNATRRNTSQYVYFFGFEQRAAGIPLTRSKQERNLRELGEWVARLRQLPVELDDKLLAQAFQKAHSAAEVYRLETIEQIFGSFESMKPATLAEMTQTMRTNLVEVWRDPALQKEKQSGRRQRDIEAEVMRGYELARTTVGLALTKHPESWELMLVRAALGHDENNYRKELGKDPEFAQRRREAFADFRAAAELYLEQVEALAEEEETTEVFELWFYAALGACDLRAIDPKMQLASAEIPAIRAMLEDMQPERAERHMNKFASSLFTRMSNANPGVKFRYVREGLAIVGDNELAHEARQVYEYYADLVTEIQLRTSIDGSDQVGRAEPFGLFVDIRHTREIERESGGFGKYLQNQNQANWGFNYGRPTEDYRDKFEEAARERLGEHFEVLSVTFNDPAVRSKADAEYGWRVTPYAYLLLEPRGPEIDRVPSLHLDLDFLDTSGYAVLPVESAPLPIDAARERVEESPYENLALTQVLNERFAKDGKLVLEVKATATGLVPGVDALLDVAPAGFDRVATDDQGVSVVQFAEDGRGVVSERNWSLSFQADPALALPPDSFRFGSPKVAVASSELFRYLDADMIAAEETVSLERRYGEPNRGWLWWIPAAIAVILLLRLGLRSLGGKRVAKVERFPMPEELTPFTVLGLLRNIEANNGLAPTQRQELQAEIQTIERHYFVEQSPAPPDLAQIATTWTRRAS